MTNTDKTVAERLAVADALEEFAMIDECEGGNPLVIATERRAAELLREASRTQEPAEVATSGSAAEYTRDQIARMAFAIYYSSNLCAPQNIAAVIEEIDTCGNDCEHVSGSMCHREEQGKFCPFSVAEDLRQLSAALYGEKEPRGYVESVFGPDRMPALRAASTPPAPERSKEEVGVTVEALFEHGVTQQTQNYQFEQTGTGAWLFRCDEWLNITEVLSALEPASHDLGYDFDSEVTESAGHPFGKAGRDFPGTYRIVTAPLYASPAPLPVGKEKALLALIREEAGKDNSPLGRSDSLAIRRIRTALGLDPHSGAALSKPREQG